MQNRFDNITNGGIGILAAATGLTVSNISAVNDWLQTLTLLLGIAIGIVTLWRAIKGAEKNK